MPRKSPRSVAGHKCRENCTEKIDERQRQSLCQQYWGLEDYKRKKDFILGNVKTFAPKQRRGKSEKNTGGITQIPFYLQWRKSKGV